ncbi:MAG: hypothetical protein L6V85_01860 [Clostridiales bacterium]|nr:MAG: hypothetical protein L6V85_01860 [Clostridiales bacterium]
MAKQKLTPEEKAQRKAERKEKFKEMNAKKRYALASIQVSSLHGKRRNYPVRIFHDNDFRFQKNSTGAQSTSSP